MLNNPVYFYITLSCLIIFTVFSLCLKNIIYSLLSAILVFFSGALLFYILGSEYNAIIQAAVYGLAVPVIIGLSIMLTNREEKLKYGFTVPYITLICGGIFLMAFIYLILMSISLIPNTFNLVEISQVNSFDIISSFAKRIYIDYIWAFELLSLLLTIVVAGLTLFKKGRI